MRTMTGLAQQAPSAPKAARSAETLVVPLVLLGLSAVALMLAWAFAATNLTGVEPNGEFISCGPALIGRPTLLPDPSCADAYGGVVLASLLFALAGAAGLAGFAWLLARAFRRRQS